MAVGSAIEDISNELKLRYKSSEDDNNQDITRYGMVYSDNQYLKRLNDGLSLKALRGIHGMPYQFMRTVDTRIKNDMDVNGNIDDTVFGRKYAEKIIARMPLLLLTPGTPKFMSQVSTRKSRLNALGTLLYAFKNVGGGDALSHGNQLNDLLKEYTGKYYSIEFAYVDYYRYVNAMCRAGAYFLNIQDVKLDGVPLKNYGWLMNTNNKLGDDDTTTDSFDSLSDKLKSLQKFLYYRQCIPFYIETENQITESFTNDTTESTLAGMVNGLSDQARELNFLLGTAGTQAGLAYDNVKDTIDDTIDNLTNYASNLTGGSNIFTNLVGNLQTVVSGGKLVFPEIWSDSTFSRSYSISMKLATPDCDVLSWYLNIYVPLCHLLGLVLPRQSDKHGYTAPFLVKGFYKGLFNIDMGIITDMTFTKGKEGGWTRDGLPTSVDVNFTIKDLYSKLSMTNNNDIKYNMMSNTAEMDYIANMCGVNINTPDIERYVRMYFTQNVTNKLADAVTLDTFGAIEQKISQWTFNVFNLFK